MIRMSPLHRIKNLLFPDQTAQKKSYVDAKTFMAAVDSFDALREAYFEGDEIQIFKIDLDAFAASFRLLGVTLSRLDTKDNHFATCENLCGVEHRLYENALTKYRDIARELHLVALQQCVDANKTKVGLLIESLGIDHRPDPERARTSNDTLTGLAEKLNSLAEELKSKASKAETKANELLKEINSDEADWEAAS